MFYYLKNIIYELLLCKAEFSAPLPQSSVSYNLHIIFQFFLIGWFAAQETFIIIIIIKNNIYLKQKMFAFTFDQFNASLLNTMI